MKILRKNKYSVANIILKCLPIIVIGFYLVLLPIFSIHAQDPVPCKGPNDPKGCTPIKTDTNATPIKTDTNATKGTKINIGLDNPLKADFSDIPTFIKGILNFVLMIGVPIVTLAIIYSGFLFVTARGNPEELKKAKKTFMYTLIGAALLLGSLVIANAIQGTVDQIKNTS